MIIGLDVGGTNIDVVAIEDNKIVKSIKEPVDRTNLTESIVNALKKCIDTKHNIERITLSTTFCTNAIIENKVEPVAMILEPGPGIDPKEYFNGKYISISGYIDHRGTEIASITDRDIENVNRYVKDYEYVGIAGKFSVRNPTHEKYINDHLTSNIRHVTMGHILSGVLNYPRRVNSTYLNSCVYKTYKNFADSIKKSLEELNINSTLYILKADGGTLALDTSVDIPINTVLSGPSASIMGIMALENITTDAVSIDIGGTTTDISFFADGVPVYEPHGIEINGFKTVVKALYSRSIGVGGDSWIRIEDGHMKIGPQREDVAMALGGKYPTPTDAFNVLGLCSIGDIQRSTKGISQIAQQLNMNSKDAAKQIYDEVCKKIAGVIKEMLNELNSRPVYTIRELLYGRKINPVTMVAVGGPAKVVADKTASLLGMKSVVPDSYAVANSIGAALSRITKEIILTADTDKGYMVIPELGIRKNVDKYFSVEEAKKIALKELEAFGEGVVIDEQVFNMVRGFYTVGKNIRITVGVKPGLITKIF